MGGLGVKGLSEEECFGVLFEHGQGWGRADVEWSAVPQCGSIGRGYPVSKGSQSSAGDGSGSTVQGLSRIQRDMMQLPTV